MGVYSRAFENSGFTIGYKFRLDKECEVGVKHVVCSTQTLKQQILIQNQG